MSQVGIELSSGCIGSEISTGAITLLFDMIDDRKAAAAVKSLEQRLILSFGFQT